MNTFGGSGLPVSSGGVLSPVARECLIGSDQENAVQGSPVSAILEWLSHLDLPLVAEVLQGSSAAARVNLSESA